MSAPIVSAEKLFARWQQGYRDTFTEPGPGSEAPKDHLEVRLDRSAATWLISREQKAKLDGLIADAEKKAKATPQQTRTKNQGGAK